MRSIIFGCIVIILFACSAEKKDEYTMEIEEFRKEFTQNLLGSERLQLVEEDMRHIDFFPANPDFRVSAFVINIEDPDTIIFRTTSEKTRKYLPLALLEFKIDNELCSLYVYKNAEVPSYDEKYRYSLFLPFTDETNGEETYGGGRYLDMDKRDFTTDSVIIDFNKAYNPLCVYGDGFSCAVPPRENDLKVAIKGGQKMYKGKYYDLIE